MIVRPWLLLVAVTALTENPIRRVVNLLQSLRQEIDDEGRKAKELFEKYSCYCTQNQEQLTASIKAARTAIGEYDATVKEMSGSNAALDLEIADTKEELAGNEKAIADATAARDREQQEFQTESAETASAIAALDKAIPAIEKGLAPAEALAQVGVKGALARMPAMSELLQSHADMSAAGSSQILGILQQMRDNFKEDLEQSTASEEETARTYEELKSAKGKQTAALTDELREKEARVASQSRVLAEAKENLEDATGALAADEDRIASLNPDCAQKAKDYDSDTQSRGQEVQAIGEAVKILNEDSAVDLFKRTLPAPSFVQLRQVRPVSFLQQRAAKGGFGPVKKMIADMIANLKQAQVDDDKQRDFCGDALQQGSVDKTSVEGKQKEQTRVMNEMKTEIEALAEKIKVTEKEIADVDAGTAEATEQRKEEHEFHTQTMSELMVAMELMNKAKAKLADVYAQPALVQRPRDDMREMLGISFVQESQPEAPEYERSTAKGAGIMNLMSELIADLKVEQQKGASEESAAQKTYDTGVEQARNVRHAGEKELVGMRGQKSSLENSVHEAKASHRSLTAELEAIDGKIKSLHEECDFLQQNYDLRKKARQQEVEAMANSLSILSGADFS